MKHHPNKYNNAKAVQSLISLYFHCEKLIPEPEKNRHAGLLLLLDSLETRKDPTEVQTFDSFSYKICEVSQNTWLNSKWQSNILTMAEILLHSLSSEQQLLLITLLLSLMKVNAQQKNSELRTAIYLTADMFNFNCEQTSKIERMFFLNELISIDYSSSLLIRSGAFIEESIHDQVKVIYLEDLPYHIWIQTIRPNNHLIAKIIPLQPSNHHNQNESMEVVPFNPRIASLLKTHNLNLENILSVIESSPAAD